jgi:hypothetical protein
LVAPFLAENDDLAVRVKRLLTSAPAVESHWAGMRYICRRASPLHYPGVGWPRHCDPTCFP